MCLSEKEFKRLVLMKVSELQENNDISARQGENNTDKQKFNREIKIIKNNHTEVRELKNSMNSMKKKMY